MKIGEKLKEARKKRAMSQEELAERLQVSRQTISNWENERSYPDIISIIKLSDIYSLSLDELLKGDSMMIEHLQETTDLVKSNRRLIGAIILNIILFILFLTFNYFLEGNIFYLILVFSLSVVSTSYLMYQIIKKI